MADEEVPEFISEDDLSTFEKWLRYQGFDAAMVTPDKLAMWRGFFDEARKRSLATPKFGLMKLQPVLGEHRYAVAVREGPDLWLTLWVRRSPKGEFFVMTPRGDRDWNPHSKLSPRRQVSHEELGPQDRFAAEAPAFNGRVSGHRAPRGVCWARSQARRCDLRSDCLLQDCRSCAWRVGAARWRSCSGPCRARLRAAILA